MTRRSAHSHVRAFSLVEVLLGIFILGIGVISIAALFPAGIVQQRQSVDQVSGPMVANNSLSIIRMKLQPADFGIFRDFSPNFNNPIWPPFPTVQSDWSWIRPGLVLADNPATPNFDERGAIDIFSTTTAITEFPGGYPGATPTLPGIPCNLKKYPVNPPAILITQQERAYPMLTQFGSAAVTQAAPQYYWDCMFRRNGGRIQVAIFVYRVTYPGGENVAFNTAVITPIPDPSDPTAVNRPRIPYRLPFIKKEDATGGVINTDVNFSGPWDTGGLDADRFTYENNAFAYGNETLAYDPLDPRQAWQEPGQWLLDQNAYLHRVLSLTVASQSQSGHAEVEFVRPVPEVPNIVTNFIYDAGTGDIAFDNVVSCIWYVPVEVDTNGDGRTDLKLTPVYATVKDL